MSKENETIIPWYLIVLGVPILAVGSAINKISSLFHRKHNDNKGDL